MNKIINEITKIENNKNIDILFGKFNNNLGNVNLKNKQFDYIKDFLNKKYKNNKIIEKKIYYHNNLKMVINNNEKKYYETNNQLLSESSNNLLCIIKKKNEINELEFPIISNYDNITHNIIYSYKYKNNLFFQLISENKNIKKFKIKVNYSKNNFKDNINELTQLWDHVNKIF